MAKDPAIKLPVAITTYQYSKKDSKPQPIGVLIVTPEGVRGYGLKRNHASRHMGLYGSRFVDANETDLQEFAQRYHDNAMNGSHIGITVDTTPYKGEGKKTIDATLQTILNANADEILAAEKKSKKK
jgi:hypothetical protein